MATVLRNRLVGLVLVTTVGWLPVAPPEHVHEEEEHGHETLVVHRHLGAHSILQVATQHDRAVDHEDAPVLTFDPVYVIPPATAAIGQAPSRVLALLDPPVVDTLHRSREYVERLIHAPPRAPTSLRAPPIVSRL
jgi:hypothetical protein